MARKGIKTPRPNLFDNLRTSPDENMFCKRSDLHNEAAVETFFVNRLLHDLEYRDNQIQTKKSISEIAVPKGSAKVKYKPDYALTYRKKQKWVIDSWATMQCTTHCRMLFTLQASKIEPSPVIPVPVIFSEV